MYDLKTHKILNTFASMQEAKRVTGINNGSISHVCNGRWNSAGGYGWRYADV